MSKKVKTFMILSIVFIALGIILWVIAAFTGRPARQVVSYGDPLFGYSYRAMSLSYTSSYLSSCLMEFGKMAIRLGMLFLILFAYLSAKDKKVEKDAKAKIADKEKAFDTSKAEDVRTEPVAEKNDNLEEK